MSDEETILLAHGEGGELTRELIEALFVPELDAAPLRELGDAAVVPIEGGRIALTTDSFVVKPAIFAGGDIGKLAVCGTVNDLAVAGALPRYLTAGFILEEGLSLGVLRQVVHSMAQTARQAGVAVVAGDTKVVERGAADGLYINTAGVGVVPAGRDLSPRRIEPGDVLLVNGTVGDHGMAVMMGREGLPFRTPLQSDCAPLNGLVEAILAAGGAAVHCLRDATRGGLATVLNEWASPRVGLSLQEARVPVDEAVAAACEFLGLDPLYVANEGKLVAAVAPQAADAVLAAMRAHPLGARAAIVGQVTASHAGLVTLRTPYGSERVLPLLVGGQLPRIC
ncbi:MAG: hydrogenase expression/formation protein HypE [Anaerolineales bacterium]